MTRKFALIILFIASFLAKGYSQMIVSDTYQKGDFALVSNQQVAPILIDIKDDSLVIKSGHLFSEDIERVTGQKPIIHTDLISSPNLVIIGTINQSSLIQQLVKEHKLNIDSLKDKWEGYQIQLIKNPFQGVESALVIVGSDRRGAAYGVLEVSKQMGVSPWYWWADVPIKTKKEIYINLIYPLSDAPKVKYRGFFINDEAPCLSSWARVKFGGFNHTFYEKVFELLLRLKANYLWPAMWGNAFNNDDKLNPILANQWGIVMGTSHHEPMLRSQKEWQRFGKGPWNYEQNEDTLKNFWKKGIENMGNHESMVTIGMRGDGDMPMSEGTAVNLLERIVRDQRQILENVTHKPASETPQVWALYKEVQDYYEKGMRVPDDVTLLLSDDNWGNIRKLPKFGEKKRAGGYGIYYHFDYVGDPRNYKWINTNNIARVYEQMHLASLYDANKMWIVNVGDIKPMEFPISFFMDYAWNPTLINEKDINGYYNSWATQQFGIANANDIAEVVSKYSLLIARRKPELLNANTYSITNYDEFANVVKEWNDLLKKADSISKSIPRIYKDAYFQLVLHPIKAVANLHEMYQAVALNAYYAENNNPIANDFAVTALDDYKKDSLITIEYNKGIASGKWNHFMDQTHIGYTSWNDPPHNIMPILKYVSSDVVADKITIKHKPTSTDTLIVDSMDKGNVFLEKDGYVSINAEHFTKAIPENKWKVIPNIGIATAGVTTYPDSASDINPGIRDAQLQYDFYAYKHSRVEIKAYFSPTLNYHNLPKGTQYGISIDDEKPTLVSINKLKDNVVWRGWVANNYIITKSSHSRLSKGKHRVKFWNVNDGVVLQKLVIDFGGVKESYLGPPETKL